MEAARRAGTAADKLIRNIVNDLIMKRIGQKICHHTRFEVGDYALRENKLRFLAENYLVIRKIHIFAEITNKPLNKYYYEEFANIIRRDASTMRVGKESREEYSTYNCINAPRNYFSSNGRNKTKERNKRISNRFCKIFWQVGNERRFPCLL